MIIRELITKLGFTVDSGALRRGQEAADNLKKKTNEISSAALEARSNIGLMLQAYLSFASAASLARVADAAQSLRARLALVPQTIGDAGAAFDELVERANFARTSLNAYGTLYVRLAGATKDYLKTQEEVLTVTDAISQALAINGATTEEAASVTLQLSQAFQKGKLDGDEFRSFMEGLSTDFKEKMVVALQDVTGNTKITLGSLYDMSANGELVAKDLALAFQKMAPAIRKQMLSIPLTIGGATQIVRNEFTAMIDRMNRESMAVTRIAAGIVNGFDKIQGSVLYVKDAVGGFGNSARLAGIMIGIYLVKQLDLMNRQLLLARARFLGAFAGLLLMALLIDKVYKMLSSDKPFFDQISDFGAKIEGGIKGIVEPLLQKMGFEKGMLAPKPNVGPYSGFIDVGPNGRPVQSNVNVTINVDVPPGTPEAQARSIASISGDALSQYITNVAGAR
jgi:tape measure domain-containing protein